MIPLIRIAKVPGYGEFKVRGPIIIVEAYVKKILNENILSRQQELITVTHKRKLIYTENFMEEKAEKSKVKKYFEYFKKVNPLFVNQELDETRINALI